MLTIIVDLSQIPSLIPSTSTARTNTASACSYDYYYIFAIATMLSGNTHYMTIQTRCSSCHNFPAIGWSSCEQILVFGCNINPLNDLPVFHKVPLLTCMSVFAYVIFEPSECCFVSLCHLKACDTQLHQVCFSLVLQNILFGSKVNLLKMTSERLGEIRH